MGDKKRSNTYVVKAGDNINSIAKRIYGNERMFGELQRANSWYSGVLHAGDVLKLPSKRSNPFVSNTEAAAQGMLGGTAETGYGYKGFRAGELNALAAGVNDTKREYNPNTPYGFYQANELSRQYFGKAGSAVGAPATQTTTPTAPYNPALTGRNFGAAPPPAPYKTNPNEGPGSVTNNIAPPPAPYKTNYNEGPGSVNNSISPTGMPKTGGALGQPFVSNLTTPAPKPVQPATPAPQVQTPQTTTRPSTPYNPGYNQPLSTNTPTTPAPTTAPKYDYQTSYNFANNLANPVTRPKVVSADDIAGYAGAMGVSKDILITDMQNQFGFKYDATSNSFYQPDQQLAKNGIPQFDTLTGGSSESPEFIGLPPINPPKYYGTSTMMKTRSGRSTTGLSTPSVTPFGSTNATWNIGG
jgi:hypothetical protein